MGLKLSPGLKEHLNKKKSADAEAASENNALHDERISSAKKPGSEKKVPNPFRVVDLPEIKTGLIPGKDMVQADADRYAAFRKKQNAMVELLQEASHVLADLDMDLHEKTVQRLEQKVANDSFKVQVVGTFKNGKSTFINSFLGEEVLPAYALPCTAVINEVKYGERKRAVLHFKHPLPEQLPQELAERAKHHMQAYEYKNVPPLEIPYDEIEDYVVIPMGKDPKDMLLESPYEKVELFWPLELLKNGIEIIDSPGLNEHATRTKVTMDYLTRADAIIFVMNATSLCSMDEMNFLENNLKAQGFCDPFFVINRYDLIPDKEKPRLIQYANLKLKPYTSFAENGLFFLSARDALRAKIENNPHLLSACGMTAFEESLSDFLTKKRGKLKLSQPANELRRILKEEAVEKHIPRRKEMLCSSLEEVAARYEKEKPVLTHLTQEKEQIYSRMMLKIEQTKSEFKIMTNRNILESIDSIPAWLAEYVPVTKTGFIPTKAKLKSVIDEMSAYVSGRLEQENANWKNNVLIPVMHEKADAIFESAESEISVLMKEINEAGDIITGKKKNMVSEALNNVNEANELIVKYQSAYEVKGLGFEVAKYYAGACLLALLGPANPAILLGGVAAMLIGMKFSTESAAVKRVKELLMREMTGKLRSTAEETTVTVSENVARNFAEVAETLIEPVNTEIAETEHQIEKAIKELKEGEVSVSAKQEALHTAESQIETLCVQLDNLLYCLHMEL